MKEQSIFNKITNLARRGYKVTIESELGGAFKFTLACPQEEEISQVLPDSHIYPDKVISLLDWMEGQLEEI